MGAEVDVHSPDGKIRHLVGMPGQGSFDVVVPDLPARGRWRCCRRRCDSQAARQRAREIARFPLDRGDAEAGR